MSERDTLRHPEVQRAMAILSGAKEEAAKIHKEDVLKRYDLQVRLIVQLAKRAGLSIGINNVESQQINGQPDADKQTLGQAQN